jgi:hypothetical protein
MNRRERFAKILTVFGIVLLFANMILFFISNSWIIAGFNAAFFLALITYSLSIWLSRE